ncbi:MAG: MarR family transcriptional regulator [Pseudomonadota bacterium]
MADDTIDATDQAYVLEDQVGYLIRLSGQRHATIFQMLAPYGLTPTQFSALIRLAQLGPCSQNELGRRAAMDVATIKGVVDRLRDRGMIIAAPDPKDKRRSVLSIAPEHVGKVDQLYRAGLAISRETMKPLSAAEQKTLTALLRKISGL